MACSSDFIDFVCGALAPLGEVRSRKMMGDYVIYVNDKCVATACDNIAYVKMHPCLDRLMAGAETACPYEGARLSYVLDFHDLPRVLQAVRLLWEELPYPKPRRKPGQSQAAPEARPLVPRGTPRQNQE